VQFRLIELGLAVANYPMRALWAVIGNVNLLKPIYSASKLMVSVQRCHTNSADVARTAEIVDFVEPNHP
jgi:hypothetical protein